MTNNANGSMTLFAPSPSRERAGVRVKGLRAQYTPSPSRERVGVRV